MTNQDAEFKINKLEQQVKELREVLEDVVTEKGFNDWIAKTLGTEQAFYILWVPVVSKTS